MKRQLISILITAMLGFSLITCAYGQECKDTEATLARREIMKEALIYQRASLSSVSIFSIRGGGSGRCSGVVIKEDLNTSYILTAKHCISIDEEIYVENTLVKLVIVSPEDDLAYLITTRRLKNKIPIKIAEYRSMINDKVYLIGYPNFDIYTASGKVIKKSKDWQYAKFKSVGGTSGGGVFNEDSKLVGILWGGYPFEPISVFEPLNDVNHFLNTIEKIIK